MYVRKLIQTDWVCGRTGLVQKLGTKDKKLGRIDEKVEGKDEDVAKILWTVSETGGRANGLISRQDSSLPAEWVEEISNFQNSRGFELFIPDMGEVYIYCSDDEGLPVCLLSINTYSSTLCIETNVSSYYQYY